jgi:rhodanese-related sulfurtransferase
MSAPAIAAIDDLPRHRILVDICYHGARSHSVTAWLPTNGFDDAVNLVQGIDAWACEIDSRMRVY